MPSAPDPGEIIRGEPLAPAEGGDIRPADAGAGGADGWGLRLARQAERAQAFGGWLHAGPRPGGWFGVQARLPAEPTAT